MKLEVVEGIPDLIQISTLMAVCDIPGDIIEEEPPPDTGDLVVLPVPGADGET